MSKSQNNQKYKKQKLDQKKLDEILREKNFKLFGTTDKKRIIILGKYGIGKTYLIEQILKELNFDKFSDEKNKIDFGGESFEDYEDFLQKKIGKKTPN